MERYIVTSISQRQGAWRWGERMTVAVVDTTVGRSRWHWLRKGVVWRRRDCDGRYYGPQSATGRAYSAAHAVAAELNRAQKGEENVL